MRRMMPEHRSPGHPPRPGYTPAHGVRRRKQRRRPRVHGPPGALCDRRSRGRPQGDRPPRPRHPRASKNGVGKTSLLECCAIAHIAKRATTATIVGDELKAGIRSGATSFTVVSLYDPGGTSSLAVLERDKEEFLPTGDQYRWSLSSDETDSLFGRSLNPLIRAKARYHGHDAGQIRLARKFLRARGGVPPGATQRRIVDFCRGRIDKLRTVGENRLRRPQRVTVKVRKNPRPDEVRQSAAIAVSPQERGRASRVHPRGVQPPTRGVATRERVRRP